MATKCSYAAKENPKKEQRNCTDMSVLVFFDIGGLLHQKRGNISQTRCWAQKLPGFFHRPAKRTVNTPISHTMVKFLIK